MKKTVDFRVFICYILERKFKESEVLFHAYEKQIFRN